MTQKLRISGVRSLYQCDLAYVHATAFEDLARGAADEIVGRLRASKARVRTVMDVGCGAGPLTRALIEAGFDVTGVDTSAELLDLARANVREARFVHASVYDTDVRNYDAVVAIGEPLTYHADGSGESECSRALNSDWSASYCLDCGLSVNSEWLAVRKRFTWMYSRRSVLVTETWRSSPRYGLGVSRQLDRAPDGERGRNLQRTVKIGVLAQRARRSWRRRQLDGQPGVSIGCRRRGVARSARRSCVASRGSAEADWREGHQGGGDHCVPATRGDFTVEARCGGPCPTPAPQCLRHMPVGALQSRADLLADS